jgi:hypothetical protein
MKNNEPYNAMLLTSSRARNATAKAKSNQPKTFGCLRCAQETGIGQDCLD